MNYLYRCCRKTLLTVLALAVAVIGLQGCKPACGAGPSVVLDDGSVVGVWASAYGETDEHYTFEIMAEASLEEQADEDLVISGETPSNPRRFTFVVAQIPKHRVSDIVTARWEDPAG